MWSPQAISLAQDFDLTFTITQCGEADGVVYRLAECECGGRYRGDRQ